MEPDAVSSQRASPPQVSGRIPHPDVTPPPAESVPVHVSSSSRTASQHAPRVRRRNRMITSCLECRRRKLKCDKSHPCKNCVTKGHRDCIFIAPALDQASQLKLTEIKEKVGSLERMLERDIARPGLSSAMSANAKIERTLPDDVDDDLPGADDERDLEPSPLVVIDALYEDDADDDDMLDLGIQIGRMRITERIGGLFRPRVSQELEYSLSNQKDSIADSDPTKAVPSYGYLMPGPAHITPSSGFFFGQPTSTSSLIDYLPSRLAADRLIKQYFTAVHPIAQTVHRPTFEKEYESFWDEVSLSIEPPPSIQALVFAAMFSGAISMDEAVLLRDFGVAKENLIVNFKLGTESALCRAHFLRTTKIETIQAFVMYLIPLCRAEVSRTHSVLVGAAIKIAECMGLHRDGESYGLNPLETHVRRLVWYQLCFLDIRTCEAQGPRPGIRKDEFDTKLPLNIDDIDLHATGKLPASVVDRWTDATFTILRFEVTEMMRSIWIDRPRVEARKMSLTAILSKIETFRRNMAIKYDHLFDDRIPLQRCAQVLKCLLLARLHVMVLHPYHTSVVTSMPDRLRRMMLDGGTVLLESAIVLETEPDLRIWKWYNGAYNQYHTAFLLLIDVYFFGKNENTDRIWRCLDYVFETNPSEPRNIKSRAILKELQEKTAIYSSLRKMRAPPSMMKHIGQKPPKKVPTSAAESTATSLPAEEPLNLTTTTIGKAPLPDVVYAGVSNNETLWAYPSEGSPEGSSDSNSVVGQPNFSNMTGTSQMDYLMSDIDWEAFDSLFPPEQPLAMSGPEFRGFDPAV